ncbi:DUF5957 family protein [Amorphoplanes digitatis]|uniref:Uncharacterized protein n=1 Tax=Actinoplanes digitatis TaxID=1868 RepID=A0A7W7HTM3_9ACTN|nr:DUF5957 family protein [Actinoplanes digitatis]MBB4760560.1 hypothetical protein [Actinoplanes digitatis]BFE68732.1 hypothetical protein GCM10020092_020330 [Actinoplanes digitatis]GID97112.1 hypothetical protein Adi01nite_65240 [Actinoplanes digitatis]
MRTIGVAVVGMFAGLLLGVVLTESAVRPAGTDVSPATALVLGLGPLLLAVLGAVAGLLIDRRRR